jgi:hypothetical protein
MAERSADKGYNSEYASRDARLCKARGKTEHSQTNHTTVLHDMPDLFLVRLIYWCYRYHE